MWSHFVFGYSLASWNCQSKGGRHYSVIMANYAKQKPVPDAWLAHQSNMRAPCRRFTTNEKWDL